MLLKSVLTAFISALQLAELEQILSNLEEEAKDRKSQLEQVLTMHISVIFFNNCHLLFYTVKCIFMCRTTQHWRSMRSTQRDYRKTCRQPKKSMQCCLRVKHRWDLCLVWRGTIDIFSRFTITVMQDVLFTMSAYIPITTTAGARSRGLGWTSRWAGGGDENVWKISFWHAGGLH